MRPLRVGFPPSLCILFYVLSLSVGNFVYTRTTLLLYGIKETVKHVERIVNPSVLIIKKETQYIYINDVNLKGSLGDEWDPQFDNTFDEYFPSLSRWWERRKKLYLWRLVEVSNESNEQVRKRAVESLASYTNLHDHEYYQLAQACNIQTTIALARIKNVDKRFFRKPHPSCHCRSQKGLMDSMKSLLLKLCKKSQHPCLNYFVRKVFPKIPKYKAWTFFSDLDIYGFVGVPPITISEENLLQSCIEALVHHSIICGDVKALVDSGGLQLLYNCNAQLCSDTHTCYRISNILTEVSTHPEFLSDIFQTGWISTLVEWIGSCDSRLSSAAATILANLSEESELRYKREVVLLHPAYWSREPVSTDVVLIHGLLGGVHYTWRQRGQRREPLSILGEVFSLWKFLAGRMSIPNKDLTSGNRPLIEYAKKVSCAIDETPQEIQMGDINDDFLGSEYVFVMTDIPETESFCSSNTSYTFDGGDAKKLDSVFNADYTMCWPKDWLPQDCSHLRVLGVNYDTRITDWTNWCPLRDKNSNRLLSERCKILLKHLIDCGIGERPVIWITHSMGGLVLKHMLMQAWNSTDEQSRKVCENTKAAVFLSTPHIGSPWATLHEAWRLLFLPSTEVNELRYQSPALQKLHNEFLKFVEEHPMEIVSFVETKSMKVSTFELEFHCVPPNIGDTGTGVIYGIPLGHMDICKPDGKFSFIYQRILSLVREVAAKSEKTS